MRSNQLVQHYSAHSGPVTNVAFHPSGDFLLSSSLDTSLKVQHPCCALQAKQYCFMHPTNPCIQTHTPETFRSGRRGGIAEMSFAEADNPEAASDASYMQCSSTSLPACSVGQWIPSTLCHIGSYSGQNFLLGCLVGRGC